MRSPTGSLSCTTSRRQAPPASASARWRRSCAGSIRCTGSCYPDRFLPMAEQTDLIDRLTEWVIDEALAQIQRLTEQGFDLAIARQRLGAHRRAPRVRAGGDGRAAAQRGGARTAHRRGDRDRPAHRPGAGRRGPRRARRRRRARSASTTSGRGRHRWATCRVSRSTSSRSTAASSPTWTGIRPTPPSCARSSISATTCRLRVVAEGIETESVLAALRDTPATWRRATSSLARCPPPAWTAGWPAPGSNRAAERLCMRHDE